MKLKWFRRRMEKSKKAKQDSIPSESGFQITEYDTECDNCEYKEECIERGKIVDITTSASTRKHYVQGRGAVCKKDPLYQFVKVGVAYNELMSYEESVNMDKDEHDRLNGELKKALSEVEIFKTFHAGML